MPRLLKQLGHALSRKQTSTRHIPTGAVGSIPSCAEGIESYINRTSEMVRNIRTNLNPTTEDVVIEGNSPFFLTGSSTLGCPHTKAVLLVHGLTDSPFVTRDLANTFTQQGFDVLSILLPGHGTCPGDLLEVNWRGWVKAQADALDALAERYSEVYLCGFSLGAVLNLYQAATDKRIKGLFLFSPALQLPPAVQITCGLSEMSQWLPQLKWLDIQPDDDSFKYESIPANAICQTGQLVNCVKELLELSLPNIPVFIAASEDDATVQTSAVIPFFERLKADNKCLLFYTKRSQQLPAKARVIISTLPDKKIISSSHMAMIVAPDNPHYGQQGSYAYCNHYYQSDPEKYIRCKAFKEDSLGEVYSETNHQQVVRRLTYNPWYDELEQELKKFIENLSN
jgi:esterase/lipase